MISSCVLLRNFVRQGARSGHSVSGCRSRSRFIATTCTGLTLTTLAASTHTTHCTVEAAKKANANNYHRRRLMSSSNTGLAASSSNVVRLALCQVSVGGNKQTNIDIAKRAVEDAADQGASLISLPECWNWWVFVAL